jgi:hypothetical protein
MEKQNVTLSLPKGLLKKAKALAARKEKSLSELMRDSLEEKVRQSSGYKEAMDRQLELMEKGFDFGIKDKIAISREEIHERR